MEENKENTNGSWSEQKEVSKSAWPIYLSILLVKILPRFVMKLLAYKISFFYFVFSKKARQYSKLYQKNMKEFTGGKNPRKISAYKHILSFSLCLIEKIEGWSGKAKYSNINHPDDAFFDMFENLRNKKGVLVIGSHLGNIELLRSMSGIEQIPVTCVMDMNVTSNFNQAIGKLNPNALMGIINPRDFGLDTISLIQDKIDEGHMVVITGDRTSILASERNIPTTFLGKDAVLPYGPFLLSSLLDCPTYFMFGMRDKDFGKAGYSVLMKKSDIDFNCSRKERTGRINQLCYDFKNMMEGICIEHPYQWYNFYDYWYIPEAKSE